MTATSVTLDIYFYFTNCTNWKGTNMKKTTLNEVFVIPQGVFVIFKIYEKLNFAFDYLSRGWFLFFYLTTKFARVSCYWPINHPTNPIPFRFFSFECRFFPMKNMLMMWYWFLCIGNCLKIGNTEERGAAQSMVHRDRNLYVPSLSNCCFILTPSTCCS